MGFDCQRMNNRLAPDRIPEANRLQTEWEGLRIVIERRPHHWQGFVYDPNRCEVLYTLERPDGKAVKLVALDFAAVHIFGPDSR